MKELNLSFGNSESLTLWILVIADTRFGIPNVKNAINIDS